jgi:hypothetical protein
VRDMTDREKIDFLKEKIKYHVRQFDAVEEALYVALKIFRDEPFRHDTRIQEAVREGFRNAEVVNNHDTGSYLDDIEDW